MTPAAAQPGVAGARSQTAGPGAAPRPSVSAAQQRIFPGPGAALLGLPPASFLMDVVCGHFSPKEQRGAKSSKALGGPCEAGVSVLMGGGAEAGTRPQGAPVAL